MSRLNCSAISFFSFPGQLTAGLADLVALTGTVAAWGWTLKDVDERAAYLTVPYLGE